MNFKIKLDKNKIERLKNYLSSETYKSKTSITDHWDFHLKGLQKIHFEHDIVL